MTQSSEFQQKRFLSILGSNHLSKLSLTTQLLLKCFPSWKDFELIKRSSKQPAASSQLSSSRRKRRKTSPRSLKLWTRMETESYPSKKSNKAAENTLASSVTSRSTKSLKTLILTTQVFSISPNSSSAALPRRTCLTRRRFDLLFECLIRTTQGRSRGPRYERHCKVLRCFQMRCLKRL